MKISFEAAHRNNYKTTSGRVIKYIVIHSMSGTFEGSRAWFKNPGSHVSSHYLVSQKGQILQMVKEKDIAQHCYGINYNSIGIELEDGVPIKKIAISQIHGNWITKELLSSAAAVAADVCIRYRLDPNVNIITHDTPWVQKLCKTLGKPQYVHYDPGKFFKLDKFRQQVAQLIKEQTDV